MKFVKSVYSCASTFTRASENCLTGEWQKNKTTTAIRAHSYLAARPLCRLSWQKLRLTGANRNYPNQSQQTKITQWINQIWKQISVKRGKIRGTDAKRGKIHATKTRMVLFLLFIGRDNGMIILTNHRAKWNKIKVNAIYFRYSIENH